ncbi:MAG: sugar ABC transporter ATP-binding protein [Candidatus Competibacteraceae bacterium]|nr:sugar ABC transporter ATP-binding protein [Candidatus Competibacteraceae bacterium]
MVSDPNSGEKQPIVSLSGISKRFGPVKVLDEVDFSIYGGEVHILAGENGAGKSTLMKILSGVHSDYGGTIRMDGLAIRPANPLDANRQGIAAIYQELSLVPPMSVADNLCLGHPIERYGLVRREAERAEAARTLDLMGLELDVKTPVEDLPISVQQRIEIAKAVRLNARVIIMDEPSSALNAYDVESLFALVGELKKQNRGIVYITHRMEEIHRLADRISVLRDGRLVGSAIAAEMPEKRLITLMVGREMNEQFPGRSTKPAGDYLRVEHFSVSRGNGRARPTVEDVSLTLRRGEILGLGGLQGSGVSDLVMGIFGAPNLKTRGTLTVDGKRPRIRSPKDAIRNGIALLTNDRKATGLVLSMTVTANICMADLGNLATLGWRSIGKERRAGEEMVKALQIRAQSAEMDVMNLSGGNQQKVAIGKWLQTKPAILLLDEPTRGVDVGAKHEIYQLMNAWTERGLSIILITSEMPELLALSDRIIIMHRGTVTAEFSHDEATAENVLEAAMGRTRGAVR